MNHRGKIMDEISKFYTKLNASLVEYNKRNFGKKFLGYSNFYRGRPSAEEIMTKPWIDLPDICPFFEELMEGGPAKILVYVLKTPSAAKIGLTRGPALEQEDFEFEIEWVTSAQDFDRPSRS